MRVRLFSLFIVMAMIAASCGSGADTATATDPAPAPAAEPTAVPTATPAPTATPIPAPTEVPQPTAVPEPTATAVPDPVDESALADVVEELVGDSDGGAVVLRRLGDAMAVVAVGEADNSGRLLDRQTPMRVGSISKPFVATMIMQLVEEGALDLDSPLSNWLPETLIGDDRTLTELMSHRSGLPNYTEFGLIPRLFAGLAEPATVDTPDDVLAWVVDIEPDAPGRYAYSNTNYVLLGQVVEAVDGVDIDTALQRRIVEPLGLQSTWFDLPGDEIVDYPDAADLASPFWDAFLPGDPATEYTFVSSGAWAAGALVSTADDLVLFLDGLASGALVSPESYEAMTDFSGGSYGFGLAPASLGGTEQAIGHSGAIPGYHSTMALVPTTGEALVVLTNNDLFIADRFARTILQRE